MRLLFDQNLSSRLVRALADLYPDSVHVRDVGLASADDVAVWEHAKQNALVDLKVRAFSHGDAGQMNFYLNWWRDHMLVDGDQSPIGLVLCSDKDETKVHSDELRRMIAVATMHADNKPPTSVLLLDASENVVTTAFHPTCLDNSADPESGCSAVRFARPRTYSCRRA